jgi:RNA polymerase sigma-70 factor (ECF subfamily)
MPEPPVYDSEETLLAAARRRDPAAQQSLYERYRDDAYRVAYRITGKQADALDVVQDAFLRVFTRLESFQGQSAFRTWLLRIVSNRALDVVRARSVRLSQPLDAGPGLRIDPPERGETAGPGRGLERSELRARIDAAVETLPPDQRIVFALHAAGEMTYGDIAEIVGIPVGTVMSRLYHARRKLQELLPDLKER